MMVKTEQIEQDVVIFHLNHFMMRRKTGQTLKNHLYLY
jgi:hypothetical protein